MKTKNIILILSVGLLFLCSVISCSKDNSVQPVAVKADLTFDTDTINIGVGEVLNVKIKTGGGEYDVFSENPDIVKVSMDGNEIEVESLDKGYSGIIVSDAYGNYERLPVKSLYKSISVDKPSVSGKIKLGNTQNVVINVISGNGDYIASSSNEEVLKISGINGNEINIILLAEGAADVTIEDIMGLTITIPVTVETTTEPYSKEELNTLMSDETIRYEFDGSKVVNASAAWYDFLNKKDGDYNLYGWDYYGYMYFKIWFDGDKSAGKKDNARIQSKTSWSGDEINNDSVNFNIIKNDGTRIWAVYSFVMNNKLYFGNFCQSID
ncbi:MAG: hypothetical protein LKI53_08785 [Bacteroidales bacterium]|jgi:hypothetical protein|nr:hypothetical protein [Bacteroidales bacterium]